MERIRIVRGRMPGVDAEDPGSVAPPPCAVRWLAHCRLAWALPGDCAVHHTGAAPASVFWTVISALWTCATRHAHGRDRKQARSPLPREAGALFAADETPRRTDMRSSVL